jgi:hypothetical protein
VARKQAPDDDITDAEREYLREAAEDAAFRKRLAGLTWKVAKWITAGIVTAHTTAVVLSSWWDGLKRWIGALK